MGGNNAPGSVISVDGHKSAQFRKYLFGITERVVERMKKLIKVLTIAVVIFAGYTVWTDPVTGPQVRAMLPESLQEMPIIAQSSAGGSAQATGRYGGIGAANSVAGAVVGSVGN